MSDRPERDDGAPQPPVGLSEGFRAEGRRPAAAAENLLFADKADEPADVVAMVRQLTASVGRLETAVVESQEAMTREVDRLRQAFATLIDLLEQQETERRVAESEWKRQEAERLRAILTAEIESHGRKRRWFWFGG